jgi:beta-glucanase (GH16 family)
VVAPAPEIEVPVEPEGPDTTEPPEDPGPTEDPEDLPAPDPVSTSDACGPRLEKADGSYWSCTLYEGFDGELDRTLWRPATGFLGGTEPARPCYVDDPSVISVQDGTLRLSATRVSEPVRCAGTTADPTGYIAGGVNTYRQFSQQYGRFEARYKSTATSEVGLQEAFWLWPDDRHNTQVWPAAGEIDIAETYSQYPDLVVPFLHYTWYDNWGPQPGLNTAWNCVAPRGEYNTYTLEWTAERLEILVNGKTCLINTSADPAFQKPYIVALTQLLGTGANTYNGPAPLPATMTVDYVKVWA